MRCEPTQYGFIWGGADIKRLCSDEKKGWVYLAIDTRKGRWAVYITKTGKVRVYRPYGGELK